MVGLQLKVYAIVALFPLLGIVGTLILLKINNTEAILVTQSKVKAFEKKLMDYNATKQTYGT